MNRPLRENLEIAEAEGSEWVQCSCCGHRLCGETEDWRAHCVTKRLPPSSMGPHRELLDGRLMLEERYCPGCGVTLDASVVESTGSETAATAPAPAGRDSPHRVTPKAVTLEPASTAVIVLDVNASACDPAHVAWPLLEPSRAFLDRARAASVPVIFTLVVWDKGTSKGKVAPPLGRRASEPLLFPNGYDKFVDGDLQPLLRDWGTKTLVMLGGAANFALLYTATAAARSHGYSVVIPLDGIYARSGYEMEYSLHQFTVLPRIQDKFRFSNLATIGFS